MKLLNEHPKIDLIHQILKTLKNLPEGQRLELPLDLLDDLIFLKIKDKEGVIVKFPVWTGDFLRKIDLSKLSFENVFFTHSIFSDTSLFNSSDLSKFVFYDGDLRVPIYNRLFYVDVDYLIDFSYTNVNIDFSKIYGKTIKRTNFEGVNLSNSNFDSLTDCSLESCNFSKTKIKNLPNIVSIFDCNFSFNDLRDVEFDLTTSLKMKKPNIFTCTNANLKCDLKLLNFGIDDLDFNIYRDIYKGFFDKCRVNGVSYGYSSYFPPKKISINKYFDKDVEFNFNGETSRKIKR